MYRAGKPTREKRFRKLRWFLVLLILAGLCYGGYLVALDMLKPHTTLKQAKATETKISYDSKTKQYDEPDFTIEIPITWQPVARPAGPYQSFTWQSTEVGKSGEIIEIFEDTIPPNFAVNKALVVSGEGDHANVNGVVSDNCTTYTTQKAANPGQRGIPAKWQGVDFLCDHDDTIRDVIGTSSMDGLNFVLLKSPRDGSGHKFLFTYTSHSLNPDYTIFYTAIQSLKMQ